MGDAIRFVNGGVRKEARHNASQRLAKQGVIISDEKFNHGEDYAMPTRTWYAFRQKQNKNRALAYPVLVVSLVGELGGGLSAGLLR